MLAGWRHIQLTAPAATTVKLRSTQIALTCFVASFRKMSCNGLVRSPSSADGTGNVLVGAEFGWQISEIKPLQWSPTNESYQVRRSFKVSFDHGKELFSTDFEIGKVLVGTELECGFSAWLYFYLAKLRRRLALTRPIQFTPQSWCDARH